MLPFIVSRTAGLFFLCVVSLACQGQQDEPLSPIQLPNQFGDTISISFPNASPVVLAFADRSSEDELRVWTDQLRKDFDDNISIIGIAVVNTYPSWTEPFIKVFLRHKPEVLMDWEGTLAKRFNFEPGECLLVSIDPLGFEQARENSPFHPVRYRAFTSSLKISPSNTVLE